MGILDSLKYLDKSRGRGEGGYGGYDAPRNRPEPPSVLDSISSNANLQPTAPSYTGPQEVRKSPDLGFLKMAGLETGPGPLASSYFMPQPMLHSMPQHVQYLEPRYLGAHSAAAATDAFQPLGLSQEELRAIDEGRAQPPARVVPMPMGMMPMGEPAVPQFTFGQVPRDTSFADRLSQEELRAIDEGRAQPPARFVSMPMGMMPMGEPAAPQFTFGQVPRDTSFAARVEQVHTRRAWPGEERKVMPHEGFAAWSQERMERMVMPQEGVYGSQLEFSSKRYTLADRANWGDTTVASLAGLADAPPPAQERKVDREGEMIRALFPQYQPGMMTGDFLRAPLIPHSETSLEDARPIFGPLPVSDKEFIVGKMDFNSMPTWTDSLVQYLKEDPTYFATRVNPEEFSTHVRQDLATVKVNPTLIPENVTRQTETAKDATAKASSSPESARHPSAGAWNSPAASARAPTPSQPTPPPQRAPGPAPAPSPSPAKAAAPPPPPGPPKAPPAPDPSPAQAAAPPLPPGPPKTPPGPPKAPAPPKAPQDGSAMPGSQANKPPPPKKKTGGIADRLAAFQKAVEDSGTNN